MEPAGPVARLIDMRTRSLTAVLALVAVVLLAACADAGFDESGPADPTITDPPVTAPPGDAPGTIPVPPPVPQPTKLPTGQTTITGEVTAGVEPNCVLLVTDTGEFLVYGEPVAQLPMGATATVRGQVRTDMATTCQQGVPFEVSEVLD